MRELILIAVLMASSAAAASPAPLAGQAQCLTDPQARCEPPARAAEPSSGLAQALPGLPRGEERGASWETAANAVAPYLVALLVLGIFAWVVAGITSKAAPPAE